MIHGSALRHSALLCGLSAQYLLDPSRSLTGPELASVISAVARML
jgi:hypothetical protein